MITNPISGRAPRQAALPRHVEALGEFGLSVELTPTKAPGHAGDLAREACRAGVDAVVVAGGDGTINEVLNGMEPGRTALATFPTGTSNILARELKIPFSARGAARVIAAGRRMKMDVGVANGRRFLMVVGVGWDAEVVNAVSAARTGHLGKHRYLAHIAATAMTYKFPPLSVTVDGVARPRPDHMVFVCNTRNYAAYFALTPDARPDDGKLDFLLVKEGGARNYVRWAVAALTGTLPRYRDVDYVQGTSLRVETAEPIPWQVDGDPGGTTPLDISLLPGALEVIVP